MASFDDSLPMILDRTMQAVMPVYRELFAEFGLTDQQWRVLRVIWTSKNVTSAELSDRTLLSQPSLVGIIDRLEKKGLVTRVRSVSDRRAIHVIATAKGRHMQAEVTPRIVDIQARIRSCVTRQEWTAMQHALEKIATGMAGGAVKETAGVKAMK